MVPPTFILWRYVMKIMTLFGEEDATRQCDTCDKVLPIEDFYLESSSKAKHNEQRRLQCKHCWVIFKGRKTFHNITSFGCTK